MADQHPVQGSSTSDVSGESSESTVELNIKTLDSQMYSFHVDKNMPVSLFKEKISSEIGVPVGQQRLIFRGKVLKDDHLLSEYHVENGCTLHLVARQPSQPQPSSNTSSGETTNNANMGLGQEPSANVSRNRVGQISHSMVLGTFNVGDQGEGVVPDLSRVIGAVLNSLGIGNQTATTGVGGIQPNIQFNAPVQAPQGETEQTQGNVGVQSQAGSQSQQFPSQSLPQLLQIPLGAALPVPSLNAPIPDSLSTLLEFINRMELVLSQNGNQPNLSSNNTGDLPRVELPSNARGVPTPEALSTVLRVAQRLLTDHAIAALSHLAERLEQEGSSTDATVRAQIQTESAPVGLAMQHLGALLLELGRTILTLRMGQSPVESSVNAGPAVYISPSGPNPIMVQPFPLQASSLFGGATAPPNSGAFGTVGTGNVPRHINIHIHTAVGPRATNGEGMQGERSNGTVSGDSGQTRILPVRNVIAAAVPSRPAVVSVSSAAQPGVNVSQPPPDTVSLSTVMAEVNSRIRNFVDNTQSENQAPAGQSESSTVQDQCVGSGAGNGVGEMSLSLPPCASEMEDRKTQSECHQSSNNVDTRGVGNSTDVPSSSSVGGFNNFSSGETTGAAAVPLGLGLGGLQPKRLSRQPRSQDKSVDAASYNATAPNLNQQTRTYGQQVLHSLASRRFVNNPSSEQLSPAAGSQFDAASAVSDLLHSPALNGLLAGVSQQTGVGSPDVLRNMLQQVTQDPSMRSTVNQLAQQIDGQDLGSMFSGLAGGQGGGGIDLSRMIQQMMPIVSQALGGGSTIPQQLPSAEREVQPMYNEGRPSRDEKPNDQNPQIDLGQVAQRIEDQNPPGEILQAMVESAVCLYNGNGAEGLVDELCNGDDLASEFMEMLRRDISQRLGDKAGSAERP